MAYVCICTPTTDLEIIQVCKVVKSEQELKDKLSICQNCKTCSDEIKLLYNKHKK